MITKEIIAKFNNRLDLFSPYALAVVRIVASLVFLLIGATKLFAWPVIMFPGDGAHSLFSQMWLAGAISFFGGGLMLVGFLTRPVAFILAIEMLVAYFQVHSPKGILPFLNGGQPAMLYFLIWFYLFFAGPGAWSLDAFFRKKKEIEINKNN